MIGLSDSPITIHEKPRKKASFLLAAVVVVALLMVAMSWGFIPPVRFGDPKGLNVQVEFVGSDSISKEGEVVYTVGSKLHYQITVSNRSNISMNKMEMQSSLHRTGGPRLPGNSLSPVHRASLSPGQSYTYEAEYIVPKGTEKVSASLHVRGQYLERGLFKSETLLCPATLRFE